VSRVPGGMVVGLGVELPWVEGSATGYLFLLVGSWANWKERKRIGRAWFEVGREVCRI
jgi:hypothetical protein